MSAYASTHRARSTATRLAGHSGRPSYSRGVHTVAVVSLKGGVGKTTVALGIASAALHRGVRTLVVDLDPQGNATASLDPPQAEHSLNHVLRSPDQPTLDSATVTSAWGSHVDVLTGSDQLELLNQSDESAPDTEALADTLGLLASYGDRQQAQDAAYDLVVLDCPPSLASSTRSALLAANSVLLVSEPTMYAIAGAGRALDAIDMIKAEANPALRPAGVLVNRFRAKSYEHQFRIDELREEFGGLVMPTAIPDRLVLQQAQGACVPIHRWNSPAAEDLALTFNMVLAKVLRSERAGRHRLAGIDTPANSATDNHDPSGAASQAQYDSPPQQIGDAVNPHEPD